MSGKIIKYWCDSGANHASCRNGEVSLEEIGLTEDEWLEKSDDERDEIMRDYALERLDWGYVIED